MSGDVAHIDLERIGLDWVSLLRLPTTTRVAALKTLGGCHFFMNPRLPVDGNRGVPMIDVEQKPDKSDNSASRFSLSEILADGELYAQIEQWSSPSFVKQGEILFQQGEDSGYAFFVKTGEIGLTMHVAGDAVWGVRARKGSLVGLPAIVGNEPYSMTARVLRDSEICKISRDDFHHLTQQNPRLCCNVLQILAGEVHGARRALSKLLVRPNR